MFRLCVLVNEFVCEKCEIPFTSKTKLKYHYQLDQERLQHPCDLCDYMAKQKSKLNRHVNCHYQPVHEGMRYLCDLCEYLTKQKPERNIHVKLIHEGLCYLCGQFEDMKFESRKYPKSRKQLGPTYFNNKF